MQIGILIPGFSADEADWAIPVQLNLVREMAQRAAVRVLALRYPHRRDTYTVYGSTVHALGAGQVRGLGRLRLWWDALHTLRRLHQEQPFTLLHAMWADETGLLAAWAGKLLGIPVVVSLAGGELVGFEDIHYGLQRGRFSRWIVGQAFSGAQGIVAPCRYTKSLIAQASYQVPDAHISMISLGVDLRVFQPSELPKRPRHLVHVASLVGVKAQATLLRAVALLDDVTLDLVGEGPERAALEKLTHGLDIVDRVKFVGAVGHLDLPPYYQRAALNVLCSRHEGLGMVTLEAAACGTPTISTAVGLLPDWPQMGEVVPVGDEQALANAIRGLLDNHERLASLSASAYQTALENFSIEHTVEQFLKLYQMLVH